MPEKIEFHPGFGDELWENLPKVVQGAFMASGLSRKDFIRGWAQSLSWPRREREHAIMAVTSAGQLWVAAMSSGLWKGAALVKDVPVKLSPGSSLESGVRAFLEAAHATMKGT